MRTKGLLLAIVAMGLFGCAAQTALIGTGDLGVVIERASGQIQIINTTRKNSQATVSDLGDLSHASVVFSRDARYAYVFGRDGGLSKIDLLKQRIDKRILQAGNSIGGAISQDGRYVAVSNYEPGGVRVFDSQTLEAIATIEATKLSGSDKRSKTVGLVDAPGNRFVFSLFDTNEIWLLELADGKPKVTKFTDIGSKPYDALITPNGRYYIAGLFGEDGMAMLDLWHLERGVTPILAQYGKGDKRLPVYKMPHLEGWAIVDQRAFVPGVGHHEVNVINTKNWKIEKKIPVAGQPVFVMVSPDDRYIWVNFALPDNDTVQIIDSETLAIVKTLKPGKAVLHMEFTPRGEQLWLSIRDENKVNIYDAHSFELLQSLPMQTPSGIFFTARAHQIGL